jgi:hypothetical protein
MENSSNFNKKDRDIIPITGYSCWALGFIDRNYQQAGCLLHPAQNGGNDLRYRVDFGDKCRREACPEAEVFAGLAPQERVFWIKLAEGLDSFAYSSRKKNPLFTILGWGKDLLGLIASQERSASLTRDSLSKSYPILASPLSPRACAFLLFRVVQRAGVSVLKSKRFVSDFEQWARNLSRRISGLVDHSGGEQFTHRLNLDSAFLDFLRLSAGMVKIREQEALRMLELVDEELEKFSESVSGYDDQ